VLAPLLVGLGVDELSAAPAVIDQVKYIIRRLKMDEARALADYALASESPTQILARCMEFARATAPSLFDGRA
jgi:phosphoenolpyruvate-protein kinase (PTS system EI component)